MERLRRLKRFAAAFTLIETILSIAVAGLVMLLVFSIYHTTMQVLRGQAARQARGGQASDALQTMSRQIACAMHHEGPAAIPFTVVPPAESESKFPELSFVFAESVPGRRSEWYRPLHAKIICGRDGENLRLVETLQPVSGPAETNVLALADGLSSFSVQVFDGEEWLEKWPQPEQPPIPRAARIRIEFLPESGRPATETEVFIPAGNTVKPTLARDVN
ncbi:MAG: hypothetical protein AB7T27_06770 [Kiritimatiellia bacterium]